MVQIKDESFNENLKSVSESDYFKIFLNKNESYIICETQVSYIPVESFISEFGSMEKLILKNDIKKFIFDKRSLRAFNQPTMEWYFIEWKTRLMALGLSSHRKILPKEEWFKKCVEAGKESIIKDNPNFPFEKLDIQYFDTIKGCINN